MDAERDGIACHGLPAAANYVEMTSVDRTSWEDAALLEATASDPDAFAAFFRRHNKAVLTFFAARTSSADVAADLMAETFAAALLAAERYRERQGPALAWLFGIARHKLVDSQRRGQVENAARLRLGFEPIVLEDEDLDRVIELTSLEGALSADSFLALLPAEQQAAIRARVLDERPYPLIARELRCSESVVRQRVSRGLRALRHHMEGTQ